MDSNPYEQTPQATLANGSNGMNCRPQRPEQSPGSVASSGAGAVAAAAPGPWTCSGAAAEVAHTAAVRTPNPKVIASPVDSKGDEGPGVSTGSAQGQLQGVHGAVPQSGRTSPPLQPDVAVQLRGATCGWSKVSILAPNMGHGKRGGFRLIFYTDPQQPEPRDMHLIAIYAKNEREDLSRDELLRLLNRFLEYLKALRARR